jgi:hypothetical protein
MIYSVLPFSFLSFSPLSFYISVGWVLFQGKLKGSGVRQHSYNHDQGWTTHREPGLGAVCIMSNPTTTLVVTMIPILDVKSETQN